MIELRFPIKAVAKGRARFARNGHAYTPRPTRDFERDISQMARSQWGSKALLDEPLTVKFEFSIKKPKTVSRQFPTVKPDLSNLIKSIEDALNGIVWRDDSLIISIEAFKHYSDKDEIILTIL